MCAQNDISDVPVAIITHSLLHLHSCRAQHTCEWYREELDNRQNTNMIG